MLSTVRTLVEDKTTGELTEELAELGAQLMVGTLIDLERSTGRRSCGRPMRRK